MVRGAVALDVDRAGGAAWALGALRGAERDAPDWDGARAGALTVGWRAGARLEVGARMTPELGALEAGALPAVEEDPRLDGAAAPARLGARAEGEVTVLRAGAREEGAETVPRAGAADEGVPRPRLGAPEPPALRGAVTRLEGRVGVCVDPP